jgi:hypothetical protein
MHWTDCGLPRSVDWLARIYSRLKCQSYDYGVGAFEEGLSDPQADTTVSTCDEISGARHAVLDRM